VTPLWLRHEASFAHDIPGHPERPERLVALEREMERHGWFGAVRAEAPAVDRAALNAVHDPAHVAFIEALCRRGGGFVDADTAAVPATWEAALRAAGGAVHGVDEVVAGRAKNAFVATRPPGHHTETARAMGFCLFNNVAIAARHAQRKHGLARVAIVDFDVHHGNGSQEIFWSDATVMYCSTHQMPLFPGTGALGERGEHDTIVNAPLRPGDGETQFKAAFEQRILPRLRDYRAELIIISAGFDAHARDPLANLQLHEPDFDWATRKLMEIADVSAGGRVVSVLEGGYDLEGLANSTAAHVGALMQA
jgi:acetoin utilization deacetylase AcuC-like enzyme